MSEPVLVVSFLGIIYGVFYVMARKAERAVAAKALERLKNQSVAAKKSQAPKAVK